MEFRYYSHHPMADFANNMDPDMYGHDAKEAPSISIKDIGMSVPLGISAQNVAGIYSKIRMGAGSLEIAFPTAGTGQRQAQTPGMYGEDQRQAIRELANINEVKLTTHAAYNIMGMMGRDPRDNFSLSNAYINLTEIQRAVDFAADTAGGGSVVVHTGEWERPMTDITLDDPTGNRNLSYDENGRLLFKRRIPEAHDANFVLLDDRTSQKMETVQKDRLVSVPKWRKAEKGHWGKYHENVHISNPSDKWMEDYKGKKVWIEAGDYIDYEGKKIINPYNPKFGRVPEFDESSNRFVVEYKDYWQFGDEAKEITNFNKKHWKEMTGKEWKADKMFYYNGVRHGDEAFLHATLETNEGHSRGWALQYSERTKTHLEAIEKLKKVRDYYEKLDKDMPEEEKWKIMKQDSTIMNYTHGLVPPESKDPLKMINDAISEQRVSLEFARQASASQQQQAEDTAETKKHIVTPTKRFKKQVARLYAEAGMRAFQKSKDPDNPVFLALENIFPERFGGHPEELKYIIDESRKWFVNLLTKKKVVYGAVTKDMGYKETSSETANVYYNPSINREKAEKIAEKHIKATFDTGHANMWRKFWQIQPGQTVEESDKAFKKWYVNEFDKLAKGGYIGNIHLTDNMGFQDDHLAPGQGNVPIKEVMAILKKNGYDKAITVEPGADASTDISDFHGLMKTWRYLGSPIYGVGGGGGAPQMPQTWGGVHYSYFGQNQPPNYIFGAYAPSNDWTLWSQVPLE